MVPKGGRPRGRGMGRPRGGPRVGASDGMRGRIGPAAAVTDALRARTVRRLSRSGLRCAVPDPFAPLAAPA